MNRSLLALALCIFAGHSVAMTAVVAPTSQQTPSSAPGTTASGASAANAANATAPVPNVQSGAAASSSKASAPNAVSVMKPATVLSAPDVPPKAAAGGKSAGARDKAAIQPATKTPVAPTAAGQAWAATAGGGATMQRGTLETINVSTGAFQVYGQKLSFNPQRVKVFDRSGRPGSIYALKSGAKVRFTMDTTDPAQRRVAVIYAD